MDFGLLLIICHFRSLIKVAIEYKIIAVASIIDPTKNSITEPNKEP